MDWRAQGPAFRVEIIILCVRRYLRYKLSYSNLVEMMAERGLSIAHTTILLRVQRCLPGFDKRWSRFAVKAGTSWRVDETCVWIRGQWAYFYRAVDAAGTTVDFRLSPTRNVAAAKALLRKAVRSHGRSPEDITLDARRPLTGPSENSDSAADAVRGVELMHRIREGRLDLAALITQGKNSSEIRAAVLTA